VSEYRIYIVVYRTKGAGSLVVTRNKVHTNTHTTIIIHV